MAGDDRDWCRDFDQHDPAFVADPWPVLEHIREHCPVLRSEHYGGFWLLTRYADVAVAARSPAEFTSTMPGVTSIPPIQGPRTEQNLPIELDPPEHSRYRALISPVFLRRRVEELRPRITARADELIDGILAAGGGDLVADFADPLSLDTLGTFMSLPAEDQHKWHGWIERMIEASVHDPAGAAAAKDEYSGYISELIRARRDRPGDDFFSLLLTSEVDGRRLTDDEVRRFGVVLLSAGHHTTAKAMAMSLAYLAEHGDVRRRLAASTELIPAAVEELLRLFPTIIMFGRNATHDVDLHGQRIGEGDAVALGYGPANRDPEKFPDPHEFRLDRGPNRHLTFGYGPHVCIGAPIARLEMTVMLERFGELVAELRLDPDQPVRWGARGDQRGLASLPVRVEPVR